MEVLYNAGIYFFSYCYLRFFRAFLKEPKMSTQDEYKYTESDLDNFMSVATKLIKEAGQMISKAIGDQVISERSPIYYDSLTVPYES